MGGVGDGVMGRVGEWELWRLEQSCWEYASVSERRGNIHQTVPLPTKSPRSADADALGDCGAF